MEAEQANVIYHENFNFIVKKSRQQDCTDQEAVCKVSETVLHQLFMSMRHAYIVVTTKHHLFYKIVQELAHMLLCYKKTG